jgi:hypothetical protein
MALHCWQGQDGGSSRVQGSIASNTAGKMQESPGAAYQL